MQSPSPTRSQLENVWRDRVKEAKRHYREAKQGCRTALAESQDMPSQDGYFAVRQAQRTETLALREYGRVLRIFNDLTFYGKRPAESAASQAHDAQKRNR